MYKVGLIGCGGMGAVHASCWMELGEDVKLVAVADADEQKRKALQERSGARAYADGNDMLESGELDIVDICVPTFLHAPYTIKAMETVKHVIVEKPVCLSENEAQALLDACERTGALVQVAHVVRFMAPYQYLKELVDAGTYGKVIAGSFSRISPRPMWMKGHDDPKRTGSMTVDMHIHDVDYIRWLMGGEPEDVQAWSVKDENGIIQHVWSSYQYGKVLLTAEASWDYPTKLPFAQTFRVRLEKAAVVLRENGELTVYPDGGEPYVPGLEGRKERDLGINVSDFGPYFTEIRYFLEMIRTGNKNGKASLEEAVASFRLVGRIVNAAVQPLRR